MTPNKTPTALTIAGSDSSAGAGIQADLKTFSALGVYGATVITALTAQNTQGVSAVHIPPVDFIYEQLKSVFTDLNIQVVKIGMLGEAEVVLKVSQALEEFYNGPIILDPVMVSTSGSRLLKPDSEQALLEHLIPKALLITPNLAEAAFLTGHEVAKTEADMLAQLEFLKTLGPGAILIKGGHLEGGEAVDFLLEEGQQPLRISSKRIDTNNTHGTGCTLSSAIAAYILKGESLENAVRCAKDYLSAALSKANQLHIGQSYGPVHHFHRFWG